MFYCKIGRLNRDLESSAEWSYSDGVMRFFRVLRRFLFCGRFNGLQTRSTPLCETVVIDAELPAF